MNKLIFGGSLAGALFLIAGTFIFPTSSIMWLASTSLAYTVFRFMLAGLLLAVLFTSPPRKLILRALMGGMGVLLVALGTGLIIGDSTHILDIILFLEAGIAFGIEALELDESEYQDRIQRMYEEQRARLAQQTAWRGLLSFAVLSYARSSK